MDETDEYVDVHNRYGLVRPRRLLCSDLKDEID